MRKEEIGPFGAWALGLLLFIATLIIIRWAVDFVTWSTLDSGWAQAIGSVAAIWFAYIFGERQAAAALVSVREAERIGAMRRYDSILALADSAKSFTSGIGAIFHDGGFGYLELRIKYQDGAILDDLIAALKEIPAHELGSYNAVLALASLRKAMFDFKGNVTRAREDLEKLRDPETNGVPPWHTWDSTALHLCVKQINRAVTGLEEHRPSAAK